jgi:mannose-6-phosphate isomerase
MHNEQTSSRRPWGSYAVLGRGDFYQVKCIVVEPGRRPSYQSHRRRAEHWLIVEGHGTVTVDGVTTGVGPGSSVDIGVGTPHRIENTSDVRLLFIEVQLGDYFGEDDIVRLADDFGRA